MGSYIQEVHDRSWREVKTDYSFYRQANEAINELNTELEPELPLLVGGSSGFRTDEAIHLARAFARDSNPKKKLDFLSFHHYWVPAPKRPGTIPISRLIWRRVRPMRWRSSTRCLLRLGSMKNWPLERRRRKP